ncbi:tetratricopeptide repeat protein (macronuclear) [Tetrahymena thermophila SB210]|uniref:Tetratricopeptide repeat protein n=1 Tax=Tetrahymena thermophila (strain SB210) TaxID=312017 RepID=Q248I8_TETTS|nr:tetratricopeptide repeat protein [Tetrahymena thermophila SB210]EAS04197.2 tetratricopeptide repeat protein [Tetrahymena thermophila SB210]|eukprot:XP_001024442.2 tetratricopeptide repeat protein [Tetrahymena thermophila SB210]
MLKIARITYGSNEGIIKKILVWLNDLNQSSYTYCSYREFMFNECPKNVYSQINESPFYVQLYFVRSLFKFELLTPEQQYFIKMNEDLSFYSGAAFLASQSDGIIQISNIYNSDTTSLQVVSPSVWYNYTQASYQTCNGDQFIEPYDARCRFWFQYAKQYPGIFIFQPYNDALTGTLELSLSSQVLKDSKFYSVHTINFVMQNLVQIFNAYLSQNSYSVLFHEFNTTVLYHPSLVFYQKMTWVDVEYLNINQFCSDKQELLEYCYNQKEQLSNQINKTVQFIKTGNYSIENQFNLEQLYQYWERFGQKQISIIFPIQCKFKGLNNQYPYSHSIIMIARVITDESDNLKLFNLLNTNIIRIYLIIEFALISSLILFFIINYGYFLVYQISNPIELLTLFLRKSYQQQQTSQTKVKKNKKKSWQYLKKKKSQKNLKSQNSTNNKKNNSSSRQNLFQIFIQNEYSNQTQNQKYIEQSNIQWFKEENSHEYSQNYNFSNQQNKLVKYSINQIKSQNTILQLKQTSNSKQDFQMQKDNSIKKIPQSSEKIYDSCYQSDLNQKNTESFEQSYSVNKNNCSLNTIYFKQKIQRKKNSKLEDELYYKKKQERKNIFLQELKPLFLEMKIIKNVFKDLESLINYSIDAQNQNSQNYTKSLIHFSMAKSTFQQLKNQTGLGRCYYNLGIVSLLNCDYNLAEEYFESAILLSFEALGTDYQNIINQKIIKQSEENTENTILIISKRIFSKAYCLKQQALQNYYKYENLNIENNNNKFCIKKRRDILQAVQQNFSREQIQLLRQSLETFQIVLNFVENNQYSYSEIFQIFLYQEIIEVLIFLNFNDNNNYKINKYIKAVHLILSNSKQLNQTIGEVQQKASIDQKKCFKQSIMNEINLDINKQIIQNQKSRQLFLFGLNEQFNNNYLQSIQLFTQSIEEGTHYNPILRKKATFHLSQLFNVVSEIPFKDILDYDDQTYLFKQQKSSLDLIVLLQLDYYKQHSTVEFCLKTIQESNLLNGYDRIQILIYDSNVTTFMPFTHIKNNNHWSLIIGSLKALERIALYDEISQKQQLTWQEALFQSINLIYEINQSDLISLKQNFQLDQTNQKNHIKNSKFILNNQNIFKRILINNSNKVILLFSKDQQTDQSNKFNYQLKLQQKQIKYNKPIIYHLKEYPLIQSNISNFNSQDIIYESFYDENQLISNLIKFKNEENLNDESEFLAILNNT